MFLEITKESNKLLHEISGSHSGKYEAESLLGCTDM
jgi:hypothetical protein